MTPGPVCRLREDRRINLWVDATHPAQVMLELGSGAPPVPQQVDHGLLYKIEAPPDTTSIAITVQTAQMAQTAQTPRPAHWLLQIEEPRERPAVFWQAFDRCISQQDCDGSCQLLTDWLAEHPDDIDAGAVRGLLGRILVHIGHSKLAKEQLTAAVAEHHRAHHLLGETSDATVLALLLIEQRDLEAARAVLAALPTTGELPADARYYAAYYQGLLAETVGDPRSALRHLSAAAELATRIGMAREQQLAEQLLARQLQGLGRSDEAAALFARLRRQPAGNLGPCDQAHLLNNHAWALLLAVEAGHRVDDPTPLLDQALDIFSEQDCRQSDTERANVVLNLALAHLQQEQPAEARRLLDHARQLSSSPPIQQRLWWLDIAGRIALASRRGHEAEQQYRELEQLARMSASPEALWRAVIGRARALRLLDRPDEALSAFSLAEDLLDQESLQIPLHEGRETFVATRGSGTSSYLDLLLDIGDPEQAMLMARRARARILRGLRRDECLAHLSHQEQAAWDRAVARYHRRRAELEASLGSTWSLPVDQLAELEQELAGHRRALAAFLDETYAILQHCTMAGSSWLPPPAVPGELTLMYHPLPDGWLGFAQSEGVTRACRLGEIEPALDDPAQLSTLSKLILSPFQSEIEAARRIRILSFGPLRQVDFHALPFGDDILLQAAPVVYGLDLAIEPPPPDTTRDRLSALVVADPNGNLPGARTEADVAAASLRRWGAASVQVLTGDEATGEAVRARLPRVGLFHYAGHAHFDRSRGWGSAMPLAAGGELTIGDILTLERAPARVVLSGCETARTTAQAPIESIALSHAFVLRGTAQVIATVRPVADETAIELSAELYQIPAGAWDAAESLRRAQLAVRQRHPNIDWASYRVVEP